MPTEGREAMLEINNDEVICPACSHQFHAVPVNVQKDLFDWIELANEERLRTFDLEEALRNIMKITHMGTEGSMAHECFSLADAALNPEMMPSDDAAVERAAEAKERRERIEKAREAPQRRCTRHRCRVFSQRPNQEGS